MAPNTNDSAEAILERAKQLANSVLALAGCLATAGITLPAGAAGRLADATFLAATVKNQLEGMVDASIRYAYTRS